MKKYIPFLLVSSLLLIPTFSVDAEEENVFTGFYHERPDIIAESGSGFDLLGVDNGTQITTQNGYYPTYSPDGQYIVYTNSNDNLRLYMKSANDTTNGVPITSGRAYYPMYSPDGQYIIYTSQNNELIRKNANDTLDGTVLLAGATMASYSPDGQYIVYILSGSNQVFKKNANDTSLGLPFPNQPYPYASFPKYSADGQYIYYIISGTSLYKLKTDGTGTSQQTLVGAATYFNISNDGQYIVYRNSAGIYRKNASDTSVGTQITTSGDYPTFSTLSSNYIVYGGSRLYKTQYNYGPSIASISSTATTVTQENYTAVPISVSGVTDANIGNTLTFSYSFNGVLYTNLSPTVTTPKNNDTYASTVDFSSQSNGTVTLYIRAFDGVDYSNVLTKTFTKSVSPIATVAPTNFTQTTMDYNSAVYTWTDTATGNASEDKFIIRDQNGTVVKDNIAKNAVTFEETGLSPSTTYQRKLCAVNTIGEACGSIISYTTPVYVETGESTFFDFYGISIQVLQNVNEFKITFTIAGFKINFTIEKL